MKLLISLSLLGLSSALPSMVGQKSYLDVNKILCPVLASMYNAGHLVPDKTGSVTLEHMEYALKTYLKVTPENAKFQATGIAVYDYENKESLLHRNRCLPGSKCAIDKLLHGVTQRTERWFNIFRMNGLQTMEHGFSTGVRGGATNVPDFDHTGGPCNGTYPCEERFQKFYVPCADKNGRFYKDQIYCVICKAAMYGDRGGEWAHNPTKRGQQWQMAAAMTGWLAAFGRNFTTDPHGDGTYFTMQDVRDMVIHARYPKGWVPRTCISMKQFIAGGNSHLPCEDAKGNLPTAWEGTSCPSKTTEKCTPYVGSCKNDGATCDTAGRCICGLGSNGVSMCAVGNKCVERENKCTYFGEPCRMVPADNPSAPF